MKETIYDNSNIAESYAGVTTPLTFSFARYVYQEVYQHFSKMMGASNTLIRENRGTFEHMIEFIGYRIYYNLNSWYTMLSFFPAYKFSSKFMEKMMGVEKHNTLKITRDYSFYQKYFLYLPKTISQTIKISLIFLFLGWSMKRFSIYFEKIFSEFNTIDLDKLSLQELTGFYEKAEAQLLAQWRIPIANDFAVMVSAGLTDKLFRKWLASDKAYSYMDTKIGDTLASLDPGKRMMRIAKYIQQDAKVNKLFSGRYSEEKILKLLYTKYTSHQVTSEVKSYLREFGTRMPNELKLESETLMENPKHFITIVRKLVEREHVSEESPNSTHQKASFKTIGLHKRVFLTLLLRWAGNSIRRREEARFHRTLIFGFIRRIFLSIGKKMKQSNSIKNDRDVFYLTKEEIFSIIDNKKLDSNPASMIKQRKRQFKKWQAIEFPRRIETAKKIFEIEQEILHQSPTNQKLSWDKLAGRVASCPNNSRAFSGRALTLKKFDPAADYKGKILVTCQTDPGWTIIFQLLKGVVVERGGMLSHAAIVARELNIPCIVGVEHATKIITNGTNIKLDLQNGTIQRV